MSLVRIASAFLLVVVACSATLSAQIPPVPPPGPLPAPTGCLDGSYELTNLDGTPIKQGITAGCDVSTAGGKITGDFWATKGGARIPLPKEKMCIEPVPGVFGAYTFVNAAGNTGMIAWNGTNGRFESIVISGPNAGTQRAWNPR